MIEETRGSEKLLEHLAGHKHGITPEALKAFVTMVQKHDARLVHILDHGQPVPDILTGAIHSKPEATAALLNDLILFREFRLDLNILINGIPFPDLIRIEFKTPGFGRY